MNNLLPKARAVVLCTSKFFSSPQKAFSQTLETGKVSELPGCYFQNIATPIAKCTPVFLMLVVLINVRLSS